VCYTVAVQPIVVCSNAGTSCAPFNTLSKVGNPGAATSTTPIGFTYTNPTTGTTTDITRALLNQIGVDITWLPVKQYNNTSYQSITISSDANGNLTSSQFQTLSQQVCPGGPCIKNGDKPTPPLNPIPTVLNMFFVNTLVPPTPGTLYGFSWFGANGIVIGANAFFPPWPLTPRYANLAHEIGHALGLNHADSYNYSGTAPPFDLMTAGNIRTEPTSPLNALTQLGSGVGTGTADQLNTMSTPNAGTSFQQNEVSTSGFLNPIASSTTTATTTAPAPAAAAMAATAIGSSSTTSTLFYFNTSGPINGRPGETLIRLILSIGPGLDFDRKVNFSAGGTYVKNFTYKEGQEEADDGTEGGGCPVPRTECLVIKLTGLPAGQNLKFSQGITYKGKPATLDQLAAAGVTITKKFSGGLIIPTQLTGSSAQGSLQGDSQQPAAAGMPARIDRTVFTQAPNTTPCSTGTQTSSDPTGCRMLALVLQDVDPAEERQPAAVASCKASSSLSALIQPPTQPTTVTAYVPNGSWTASNTGIQVVPIEPAGGVPVPLATTNVVNSCASNSMTGQTVCTANNTDVYLLSGTSITQTLTSGATGNAGFSGGFCQNCGVAINQLANKAVITMGLPTEGSPSRTGIQFLNLKSPVTQSSFSSVVAAANHVSEDVLWDPSRQLMLLQNEQGAILSPNENGVYDLFDTSASNLTLEFGNNVGGELDTAAEDCLTGIALASDEFTTNVFLADLTQATFNPASPSGAWQAGTEGAAQQFVSLPEFGGFAAGTSGLAVAPGLHLAVVTGEFGGNKFGILLLPDHSGIGTPNIVDYAAAALPNAPDGPWSQGLDPHTVTAYVSPNDGKAYALMANAPVVSCGVECISYAPPTYLAVVDMKALLDAPRVTTEAGTHNVDPSYDLIAHGVVRYVRTH